MWGLVWAGISVQALVTHQPPRGPELAFVVSAGSYALAAHDTLRRAVAGLAVAVPGLLIYAMASHQRFLGLLSPRVLLPVRLVVDGDGMAVPAAVGVSAYRNDQRADRRRPAPSPRDCPTPRSRPSCTSARPRSRATWPACWPSWTCVTGCRSRFSPTRAGSSGPGVDSAGAFGLKLRAWVGRRAPPGGRVIV